MDRNDTIATVAALALVAAILTFALAQADHGSNGVAYYGEASESANFTTAAPVEDPPKDEARQNAPPDAPVAASGTLTASTPTSR